MRQRGFTLIEIMVAVTIFGIVMLVLTGAMTSIIDANRKVQSIKSAVNNLAFTLESMTRVIRTGVWYHCRSSSTSVPPTYYDSKGDRADCSLNASSGGLFLGLEPQEGNPGSSNDQVAYRLLTTSGLGRIERRIGAGSWEPMTAPEIDIDYLRFFVDGQQGSEGSEQPWVLILVKGTAQVGNASTTFFLQTAATQRMLDI